jgi:hypothetical protein
MIDSIGKILGKGDKITQVGQGSSVFGGAISRRGLGDPDFMRGLSSSRAQDNYLKLGDHGPDSQ